MGIPSYFKRLVQTKKTLLLRDVPTQPHALAIDFNCIVYTCLRDSELSSYPGDEDEQKQKAWEQELLQKVCKALKEIHESAQKPSQVFVAVDGVVPMAKIRQQRMRRFKSIWWAEKEYEMGVRRRDVPRWDTNAITPGTAFMASLNSKIGSFCQQNGWQFSSSNEPGEGEHKLIQWLRSKPDLYDIVIFGLDADLILLSMLCAEQHSKHIWLMREKNEFQDAGANCKYMFFDVCQLSQALFPQKERLPLLLDYIAGMSFLGNDFLPHGLCLKIKDDGHEHMMKSLDNLHKGGHWLVEKDTLNFDSLKLFVHGFAETEENDMLRAISKKYKMRPMAPRNEVEQQMLPVQGLPLEWKAEQVFGTPQELHSGWKDIYRTFCPQDACSSYLYGLQWILDYYLGKPVRRTWFFSWHLPPLCSDFYEYLNGCRIQRFQPPPQADIQAEEQLAMVLPLESWHLIQNSSLRRLPSLLPQFWPSSFGFLSLGRYWMWECEADVPILTPGRIHRALEA
jgi:5'-3' exonuclease